MTLRKIIMAMTSLCFISTGTVVAATPLQKECKKVIKQMKKEGWEVADGSPTLEAALTKYYETLEVGGLEVAPVIGSGTAKNFNLARSKATSDATAQFAKMRGSEVKGTTEMKVENTNQDGKVSSKVSMDASRQSKVKQNVKAFKPVAILKRTGGDGVIEVKAYYVAPLE